MCLRISQRTKVLVQKCYKSFVKRLGKLVTYYYYAEPNENGLLIPKTFGRIQKDQTKIEGGFIHAWRHQYSKKDKESYALNVKAYGGGDLVCRALYTPKLDKSGKSKERVKKLLEAKTIKDIEAIFPELYGKLSRKK